MVASDKKYFIIRYKPNYTKKLVFLTNGPSRVCKTVSPNIIHKTNVGVVILELLLQKADQAYNQILQNIHKKVTSDRIEVVLMKTMIFREHGYELIWGVKDEPGIVQSIMFVFRDGEIMV